MQGRRAYEHENRGNEESGYEYESADRAHPRPREGSFAKGLFAACRLKRSLGNIHRNAPIVARGCAHPISID